MKKAFGAQVKKMFEALNTRLEEVNRERIEDGTLRLPKAEVTLLGQMSLLADDKVSAVLSLAQTGDMDAILKMNTIVKNEFKGILKKHGLIYDEDSHLVWIPPKSKFQEFADYSTIKVNVIDPESALVSKAVKAPEKNKQLIREAIASGKFPGLVKRIIENGGKLENFA